MKYGEAYNCLFRPARRAAGGFACRRRVNRCARVMGMLIVGWLLWLVAVGGEIRLTSEWIYEWQRARIKAAIVKANPKIRCDVEVGMYPSSWSWLLPAPYGINLIPLDQIAYSDIIPQASLYFDNADIRNLTPLQKFPIRTVVFDSNTRVADFAPLRKSSVKVIMFSTTRISDLKPFQGMNLDALKIYLAENDNLAPLVGMPLKHLVFEYSKITDLSSLQNMPLKTLAIRNSPLQDLTPLKGMALEALILGHTQVVDLSPLKGMPLTYLELTDTKVDDLTPLQGMPLRCLDIKGTPAATKPLPTWLKNCEVER